MEIIPMIRPNLSNIAPNTKKDQIHIHSTGNPTSTALNEANYMLRKDLNSGYFSHVVGNGKIYQTAPVNLGYYDLGGGWNSRGYASIELIESHKTYEEFYQDYRLYIDLIRKLCIEGNIPLIVDNGSVGVISHQYATKHQPYNNSDHIDPYPYLSKWGISKEQFIKDLTSSKISDKPQNKKEVITMVCTYQLEGDNTIYYFNGDKIIKLDHIDQLKLIQEIYIKNNGKAIPHFIWNDKAPFNKRLEEIVKKLNK